MNGLNVFHTFVGCIYYGKTNAGTLPVLPETVQAVMSDLSRKEVSVSWNAVTEDEVRNPGTIRIEGTVEGIERKAAAYIHVEAEGEETEADRTLLLAAIDYAKEAQKDESSDKLNQLVRDAFESALAKAEETSADPEATQEKINQAWSDLVRAIHMLASPQTRRL